LELNNQNQPNLKIEKILLKSKIRLFTMEKSTSVGSDHVTFLPKANRLKVEICFIIEREIFHFSRFRRREKVK